MNQSVLAKFVSQVIIFILNKDCVMKWIIISSMFICFASCMGKRVTSNRTFLF